MKKISVKEKNTIMKMFLISILSGSLIDDIKKSKHPQIIETAELFEKLSAGMSDYSEKLRKTIADSFDDESAGELVQIPMVFSLILNKFSVSELKEYLFTGNYNKHRIMLSLMSNGTKNNENNDS